MGADCLLAKDIVWNTHTTIDSRAKLKSRVGPQAGFDPVRRGNRGHLKTSSNIWTAVPYLCTVRANVLRRVKADLQENQTGVPLASIFFLANASQPSNITVEEV